MVKISQHADLSNGLQEYSRYHLMWKFCTLTFL